MRLTAINTEFHVTDTRFNMPKSKQALFRVRFQTRDDKKPFEVVVRAVDSSEFMGLLALEGFVFNDTTKQVILPTEDEARKRFGQIEKLHIPYHNILFIEEFLEEERDLKNLPFMREVESEQDS